jgi:hypothetical protein
MTGQKMQERELIKAIAERITPRIMKHLAISKRNMKYHYREVYNRTRLNIILWLNYYQWNTTLYYTDYFTSIGYEEMANIIFNNYKEKILSDLRLLLF